MKAYFITTESTNNLKTALGRLVEYAKFLEEESGRTNESFVDTILNEEDIKYTTEETTMSED